MTSKFDGKFTEVLYNIALDGGQDETIDCGYDGYVDVYDLILTPNRGHIIFNGDSGSVSLVFSGQRNEAIEHFAEIDAWKQKVLRA